MVVVRKSSSQSNSSLLLQPQQPPKLSPGLIAAHLATVGILAVVFTAAYGFQDATSAMAFYGVFHREPLNQVIHFFGVPLILWTLIVFQAHLPITSMVTLSLPGIPKHNVSWATISVAFYIIAYLFLDIFGGLLYMAVWYFMYATAVHWTVKDQELHAKQGPKNQSWTGTGQVLQWAFFVHVLAWYVQIHPGHKVIEGAQPAIMQSLGGALFTAPLFAFYEGIWWVGLRQDFHQQVLALVADYTKELCAKGVAMRACESLREMHL